MNKLCGMQAGMCVRAHGVDVAAVTLFLYMVAEL